MNKRYSIQVRQNGNTIATVQRVLRAEQIGNFNPLFCRYQNNKRVLVKSDDGDLSDPFRREDSYAASLYITI